MVGNVDEAAVDGGPQASQHPHIPCMTSKQRRKWCNPVPAGEPRAKASTASQQIMQMTSYLFSNSASLLIRQLPVHGVSWGEQGTFFSKGSFDR
jgi:hypothetical protein